MTVIPPGYAQANFVFGGIAMPNGAEVTLGIDVSGWAGTPTSAAIALASSWNTNLLDFQPSFVSFETVRVKYGPEATGPTGEAVGGGSGGSPGNPTSPNVAYLVRKSTAFGGRAGRGRFYMPGVTEDNIDGGGVVLPAGRAAINTGLDDFRTGLESIDSPIVLLHGVGSPLTSPTPVTDLSLDARVATQRRRLRP